MAHKISILSIIFLITPCIGGCNQKPERLKIFNSEKECYYTANSWIEKPALEDFGFFMPLVTNSECKNISNLEFYYQNKLLDISVSDLKLSKVLVSSDTHKDYRYTICALLNKKDVTEKLLIDKMQLDLDGNSYSFPVNLCFSYQYIQSEYRPYYCFGTDSFVSDNKLNVQYLITCPVSLKNWAIEKVSIPSISDNPLPFTLYNEDKEEINSEDTLNCQQNYRLIVQFDLSINTYVSSNLLINILFNDKLQKIQCCTSTSYMDDLLSYAVLSSGNIQFFE